MWFLRFFQNEGVRASLYFYEKGASFEKASAARAIEQGWEPIQYHGSRVLWKIVGGPQKLINFILTFLFILQNKIRRKNYYQRARETSPDLLSSRLLFTEFRFGAMLCSNFGNENSDAGHINLHAGLRFPTHLCHRRRSAKDWNEWWWAFSFYGVRIGYCYVNVWKKMFQPIFRLHEVSEVLNKCVMWGLSDNFTAGFSLVSLWLFLFLISKELRVK